MSEFDLIVEEDADDEWAFNIKFDRPYDITSEKLPISSDCATRVLEEAYTYGYAAEDFGRAKGNRAVVGTVTVDDDPDDFDISFDADLVDEIYG